MNKQQLSQIIVFSLMLIGAVAAIVVFFMMSYSFGQSYLAQAPVIVYNRGLWAMLGVGVGLGGLVTLGVSEALLKRDLGPRATRWVSKLIVGGIILMFALPVASGLAVVKLLGKRGYFVCEQAAYPYSRPGLGEKIYLKQPSLCMPWQEFRERVQH